MKSRLQEFVFGEGEFSDMEPENTHQISRDLMDVLVESILKCKIINKRYANTKLMISNHDEIEIESFNRLEKIKYRMTKKGESS
jgi:hypothetical protein